MTLKLIYLHIDCETFNYLPALEQVRRLFRVFETSTVELFAKIVSNVNLKPLTSLVKMSNLNTTLCLESSFAG